MRFCWNKSRPTLAKVRTRSEGVASEKVRSREYTLNFGDVVV